MSPLAADVAGVGGMLSRPDEPPDDHEAAEGAAPVPAQHGKILQELCS